MSSVPKFQLDQPRFDQSTFSGRLQHFMQVIDPRTLLVSDDQLQQANNLLQDFAVGKSSISDEQLWEAKRIKDSIVHPDTGDKVFAPFRMSAFVPMNVPIVLGMLTTPPTLVNIVFWQWLNQTYNVCVNHANRNASNEMSTWQLASAYAGAVASSCSIALALNTLAKKVVVSSAIGQALVKGLVPYIAVATAGAVNVLLMRKNEMEEGIAVKDLDGNVVGVSKKAGQLALFQVAVTRVVLPIPVIIMPSLIMNWMNRTAFVQRNPRLKVPLEAVVVTASLAAALPLSISLFPQVSHVKASDLEPQFHNLQNSSGQKVETLMFNKGL